MPQITPIKKMFFKEKYINMILKGEKSLEGKSVTITSKK